LERESPQATTAADDALQFVNDDAIVVIETTAPLERRR
jgi:hypothetical protein